VSQPIFLRIFSGEHLVAVKQFDASQVVFGKDAQVDVDLADDQISNIHAMIELRDGNYYLCDLGSKEGTKLNDQAILDQQIQNGDIVGLGKFRIEFYIGIPKPKAKPAKTVMPTPPAIPTDEQIQHAEAETVIAEPSESPVVPPAPVEEVASSPEVVEEEAAEPTEPPAPILPENPEGAPNVTNVPLEKPDLSSPMSLADTEEASVDPSGNVHSSKKRKRRLTYAPPSNYSSLDEVVRPGKGVLLDVMLAWGDRIIETHRIKKDGQVSIGSHPKNDIVLPSLEGIIQSQPFIRGANSVSQVFVPKNKRGYLLVGKKKKMGFKEAEEKGRAVLSGNFWVIELQQEEMLKIDYGNGLSVYVTYAGQSPSVIMDGLSNAEIMSIVGAIILSMLLYFISNTWGTSEEDAAEEKEKSIRVTRFEFKRNEPIPKNKVIEVQEKKKPRQVKTPSKVETNRKDKLEGKPGKAAELRANKNRLRDKMKLAAEKKGKASRNNTKRVGKKSSKKGTGDKAKKQAPPDLGLAGFFAKGGGQDKLNKVVDGRNNVLGASKNVTGAGGGSGGVGSDSGLANISKGGAGEATIGKQSVNTKGKQGGLGDYGEGGLGQKGTSKVDIGGEGTEFIGTIDKEAVRRVIQANKAQVRACYEEELNKNFNLYGKVTITWDIQAQGRVGRAFVKSSTLKNRNVEKCIVRRLKTWRFPVPPQGTTARVSYPFVFSAR
jgi:TonB family protein